MRSRNSNGRLMIGNSNRLSNDHALKQNLQSIPANQWMCLAKNMEMEVESFKDKIKTLDD